VLRRIDTLAIVLALAFHAGIAFAMIHMPVRPPTAPTVIEVAMRKPPPQTVMPEPPPPPERKIVQKIKQAPPPNTPPAPTPKEPPKEPPKPVFGMAPTELTNDDSNVAMPVGNSTMADPKGPRTLNPTPLPGAPPGGKPGPPAYKPVADVYVKKLPDIDGEACARMVQYPSEAEQLGIEGDVKLRVSLDETGKVHEIKVLHGLGHGLDEAAKNALMHKCKFSPAIGTDGKPVAYVIQTYTWTFDLPR
jgi:periplasmic protein TonB